LERGVLLEGKVSSWRKADLSGNRIPRLVLLKLYLGPRRSRHGPAANAGAGVAVCTVAVCTFAVCTFAVVVSILPAYGAEIFIR